METINNVVSGATKVIWGEPNKAGTAGQEPISGQSGAGTASEPFDQGNQNETLGQNESTTGSSFNPTETSTGSMLPSLHLSLFYNTTNTNPLADSKPSMDDTNTTSPEYNPAKTSEHPGQKQQGGDRPAEEPSSHEVSAINNKTEAAEEAQDDSTSPSASNTHITSDEQREKLAEKGELPHDPNDHSGEPMKMHNAGGKSDPEGGEPGESIKTKTERSASVAHEGGGEHGKEYGTGEQWVKTSGVAADGGDFDVTKPGAGREATREFYNHS